jgi:hypothetical protein
MRMVVAKDQSAVSAKVIDVFVAVDVPLMRALRTLDVDRMWLEITPDMCHAVR